jgi:hypothetical protein
MLTACAKTAIMPRAGPRKQPNVLTMRDLCTPRASARTATWAFTTKIRGLKKEKLNKPSKKLSSCKNKALLTIRRKEEDPAAQWRMTAKLRTWSFNNERLLDLDVSFTDFKASPTP